METHVDRTAPLALTSRAERRAGPPPLREPHVVAAAVEHLLMATPPTHWDTFAAVGAMVAMADATYRAEGREPLSEGEWRAVARWLAEADVLMAWADWPCAHAAGYSRNAEVGA